MKRLQTLLTAFCAFGFIMGFNSTQAKCHEHRCHEQHCGHHSHDEDFGPFCPVHAVLEAFQVEILQLGMPNISNGILYFGNTPANGNYGLVNSLTNKTGYVATIFIANPAGAAPNDAQFIRVSTNLTQGSASAVGTLLDPTSLAYAAVSNGNDFYGEVTLFGNSFNAAYSPIEDASGNILGVLFVGRPLSGVPGCTSTP